MIIDCAYNEKLCDELIEYLTRRNFQIVRDENCIIKSNDKALTEDEIELFLKLTYKIKKLQIIMCYNFGVTTLSIRA